MPYHLLTRRMFNFLFSAFAQTRTMRTNDVNRNLNNCAAAAAVCVAFFALLSPRVYGTNRLPTKFRSA